MKHQGYDMYPETYIQLLNHIRQMAEDSDSDRLPSEEKLAKQFHVSRVKVRDVLSQLEAAGYVIRKRGVGTRINRNVLAEHARLDIDSIYVDMMTAYGMTPRFTLRKMKHIQAPSEDLTKKLQLTKNDTVYRFEKVVYGDDIPVIAVADHIPSRYYDDAESNLAMMETDFFLFLQHMCDELLETTIVHVDVCSAETELAALMQVEVGAPLLKLHSTCYNQNSDPVMHSIEYYNTKILPFSFQKRIFTGKFNRTAPPVNIIIE